jgi:acyl-CoA synthetase (AMP-forming)/AMP-acid ligase II
LSDPLRAGSLWALIEARAEATPEAVFAVDERDRSITYGHYRDSCERVAAALAERGVGEGTPVTWTLPTCFEAFVLEGALIRLGALQNPVIPIYRKREFAFITRQTGAKLLVVPPSFRGFGYGEMARELAADQGFEVLEVEGHLPTGDPATLPPPPQETSAEDAPVRWIFYTSGTTSDPKGARHTDHTLMVHAEGMADCLALDEHSRVALAFPFTHIGGASWLASALQRGLMLISIAVFDPDTSIPLLAHHGVTHAGSGTAFHQAYLAAQRKQPDTPLFPDVVCFPGGAATKPPELHYEIVRELGGVGIVSGYGLTECPIIAMNKTTDPQVKLALTEGRVNPAGARIKVVKPDGSLAAPGEEGELRHLGPQLCKGYLDESLNAEAFDEEGYFRSGDLGFLDEDGFVTITGRLKDVIIRKGENISAKEVEDVLYTHPKVQDVSVIGLPDPRLGERCCAVVVSRDASDPLGFDEMVAFLRDQELMVQKIPEQLEQLPELPRNPAGKVLKNDLRERYSR